MDWKLTDEDLPNNPFGIIGLKPEPEVENLILIEIQEDVMGLVYIDFKDSLDFGTGDFFFNELLAKEQILSRKFQIILAAELDVYDKVLK